MTGRAARAVAIVGIAALAASLEAAQAPETITATASVRKGATSASTAVRVTISQYTPVAERNSLMKALREAGMSGARKVLAAFADAGVIQIGERRTPIKFASERVTAAGRLITVVTAEPILFLGAGLPTAKPRTGYDVAVAMLEVSSTGSGMGELVPAAKVGLSEHGALQTEDYGETVVWLTEVVRSN